MSAHKRGPKLKGSEYWVQELINNRTAEINGIILKHINKGRRFINKTLSSSNSTIRWISPLKPDYIEYSGDDMLKQLGVVGSLSGYWPTKERKGAQWDALGSITCTCSNRDSGQKQQEQILILVEAKAHIGEMISNCKATNHVSLSTIDNAINITKKWLGASSGHDWKKHFYQYANRLAHLHFLRIQRSKLAVLVFLYIVDDPSFPTDLTSWNVAIDLEKMVLGLSKRGLKTCGVIDLFYDAKNGRFL